MTKTILITGCSTGIGRDLAGQLSAAGFRVAATARQVETLKDLPAELKLPLDVTRQESVDQAVSQTIKQFSRIDVLVNNAGYGIRGVVEEISDEQVKRVYDVNVFGALRMIRAVAPIMRQQAGGRIINISSIAGRIVTPANGVYSSTKFALEALSDALRWELAPFGVKVVLIEPGAIKSQFDDTARVNGVMDSNLSTSPFRPIYLKVEEFAASMRKSEPGPEAVTKVILQSINSSRPKARYMAGVNFPANLAINLRDLLWEAIATQTFKL
jgi:NAD(P)-dependent dehydrogenase (short-subunit alcohol dehydrogenase family)